MVKAYKGAEHSQSAYGQMRQEKSKGIVGMIKNPFVLANCCFASIGTIMYGYDQGVFGSVLVMENFKAHFPSVQSSTQQGWLVAILELGAWFGALFAGWFCEKVSRKRCMQFAIIIFTLGSALQAGAQNASYLYAGRLIGGIGIGMLSMTIPLYMAEISPPELRGSLVSIQQLSITIGTMISFWLDYGFHFVGGVTCNPEGVANPYLPDGTFNYNAAHGHTCLGQKSVSWRVPLAIQIIPAWILFFGMFFFPYSPRWLANKHRDEEAIAALCKIRRLKRDDPILVAEWLEVKSAVIFDAQTEAELFGRDGWLAPWKQMLSPNIFKRVNIGVWIMIFQQFTGINAVLYYSPQIFASFGLSATTNSLLATGVTGIIQVISTLPAVFFLDNFGRRTFLIVGAIGMAICHVIIAGIFGSFLTTFNQHIGAGWANVVFIWLFAMNFAYSWGPVAWVIPQEIFPAAFRSRGVSIVASTNWIFNFIIGLVTPHMINNMKWGTYIFFAAFSAGGGIFVYFFVPETKGKTLEEMDVYFGGSETSLAVRDRERMENIQRELMGGYNKEEKTHDEGEQRATATA